MLRRWFSCHRPGVKLTPVDLLSGLDTVILPQMDWLHFVQQNTVVKQFGVEGPPCNTVAL